MHNKKINQLLIGAMLAAMAPAVSAADIPAWNGSALGFEAGQQGLLGDMLGKVRISRSFLPKLTR
ncbi:porin [Klebsiella pneumoniae]|nr:porin [Klebsiella pneumoniae]